MAEQTKRIALYSPSELDYINRLVEGVLSYLAERPGFLLRDFHYGEVDFKVPRRGPTWEGWQPHGILCYIGRAPGLAQWLKKTGVPIVNTSTDCPHEVIPSVHGAGAGRLAAEHFQSLGLEHFGFVGHQGRLGSRRLRESFAEELGRHGRKMLWHELATEPIGGLEALEEAAAAEPGLAEFLQSVPKPIGVLALHYDFARVVCLVCRRLGLAIPNDVAVLGIENHLSARLNDPPLSSICPPGEQVGYQAMRLLDALLQGEPPPPEPITVPTTQLIERESTRLKSRKDSIVKEALRLIEAEACRGLTVEDIADVLDVSRSTLHHRFVEQVGRPPGEQIARVRLQHGKRLLADSDLSVTRISGMLGFARSSIFGEFFKRQTGMTPTQFRERRRA